MTCRISFLRTAVPLVLSFLFSFAWPPDPGPCSRSHAERVAVTPGCTGNSTVYVSHDGSGDDITFEAFLSQVGRTGNITYIIRASSDPYIVGCRQVTIGGWSVSGEVSCVVIKGETGSREDVVLAGADPAVDPDFWESSQYGGSSSCGIGQFIQIAHAANLTIADLTMRNFPGHILKLDGAADSTWYPHDILFHNIELLDCGDQLIKGANWATDGLIECSKFHYTEGLFPESSYETQGIDFHEGRRWHIRDNEFRNIRIPIGAAHSRNGAAVIMWDRTDSVIVERNLVVNCDAAFKLGASWYDDESDRMWVRNNVIVYTETSTVWGVSNMFEAGRDVTAGGMYHNTVWNPQQAADVAMWYCPNGTYVFANNLYYTGTTHRAAGAVNNMQIADVSWFTDAAGDDYTLSADRTVPAVTAVVDDILGNVRSDPASAGAFEYGVDGIEDGLSVRTKNSNWSSALIGLDGRRVVKPGRGIYLAKQVDGSVMKVLVR